jgi:uncharacterized DUF497 family protein
MMEFEWDPEKAKLNWRKHRVSFQEAIGVFGDPLSVTYDDPDHSWEEQRYLTLGTARSGHMLIVSHTDRAGGFRIISARRMTRRERKRYEEVD